MGSCLIATHTRSSYIYIIGKKLGYTSQYCVLMFITIKLTNVLQRNDVCTKTVKLRMEMGNVPKRQQPDEYNSCFQFFSKLFGVYEVLVLPLDKEHSLDFGSFGVLNFNINMRNCF